MSIIDYVNPEKGIPARILCYVQWFVAGPDILGMFDEIADEFALEKYVGLIEGINEPLGWSDGMIEGFVEMLGVADGL